MVIPNCGITQKDSKVLKECVMSKDSEIYKRTKAFHTGIDIEADTIYSLYDGIVVMIGTNNNRKTVIVRTDSKFCISYSNIVKLTDIQEGEDIHFDEYIGTVKDYVHVEYLIRQKSDWPVRIGQDTWYKHDTKQLFNLLDTASDVTSRNDLFIFEDVVEIFDGYMD